MRMQGVCLECCHNSEFVDDFYTAADKATERVNEWVVQSDEMMKRPLKEQGLLTPAPFDEPIDFTYFELWHHWGTNGQSSASGCRGGLLPVAWRLRGS